METRSDRRKLGTGIQELEASSKQGTRFRRARSSLRLGTLSNASLSLPATRSTLPDHNLFTSKSTRVACQRLASTGVCRGTRAPEGQVFAAHVYRMRDDDTSMNHTEFCHLTPVRPSFQGIPVFPREKKFLWENVCPLSRNPGQDFDFFSLSLLTFESIYPLVIKIFVSSQLEDGDNSIKISYLLIERDFLFNRKIFFLN